MQSIGNTLVRCTEQIMLLIRNSGKLFYGFVSENEMYELKKFELTANVNKNMAMIRNQ